MLGGMSAQPGRAIPATCDALPDFSCVERMASFVEGGAMMPTLTLTITLTLAAGAQHLGMFRVCCVKHGE